ncbi:MAG: DUF1599 domain-containing protein [Bacteroidetes bacterium]|nr:DUF1599 domain-containing protein [Bacteroidota bacterium]
MNKTVEQYNSAVAQCREIFRHKTTDYGTAWRILRPKSLTDQIFIKAQRIRSIEEKNENKVGESIDSEYIGIFNYAVLALIQLKLESDEELEIPADIVMKWYDEEVAATLDLMLNKNHDYGEAWREMRISTFTDLILMKILRTRQIEDNEGKTLISEGLDANYRDMMNYAIFALIRRGEIS